MCKSDLRFHWAAALVQVQPDSRVLEIGCGNGILLAKMAEQLETGKVTGIDRSVLRIQKASERNAAAIETGKVQLVHTDFKCYRGPLNIFDRVVAFNVSLFLHDDRDSLSKVHSLLSSTGQFVVFYQFPHSVDISAADPIIDRLEANRFKLVRKSIKKLDTTPAFCVVASRGRY